VNSGRCDSLCIVLISCQQVDETLLVIDQSIMLVPVCKFRRDDSDCVWICVELCGEAAAERWRHG